MDPLLPEDCLKVLDVLKSEAVDGYTLMKRTGLDRENLVDVLRKIPSTLVIVKGELIPDRIGEAFFAIDPSARGYAESLLRNKVSYR